MESSLFKGISHFLHRVVHPSKDSEGKATNESDSTRSSKLTTPAKTSNLSSYETESLSEGAQLAKPVPVVPQGIHSKEPLNEMAFKIRNLDTGGEIDVRDENRPSFAGKMAKMMGIPYDDLEGFYSMRRARNIELLSAAQRGSPQRCRELLDKKVNGHLAAGVNSRGTNGETALHIAAKEGHEEVCRVLLLNIDGIDVNPKLKDGRTPLHIASERGFIEIVNMLLLCGATVSARDNLGYTPLHYAARFGRVNIVKKLLDRYADPNIVNKQGFTPINIASQEVVQILVDNQNPMINVTIQECEEEETKETQADSHYSTQDKIGAGNFLVINQLGKGSFGQVFLVKKLDDNTHYALKVLNKSHITQNNLLKYAMTEKNVMSYIRHPFIVSLRYAFQTSQKLCLVMDYCPGGDLGSLLATEKRFSEEVTRLYATEVLLALEHLHSLDIIYRDLKPDNVILDADGHAMLTDFGLSKEGITSAMTTSSFCGSIAYLAPEILLRQGHGKTVDWYLLGVMMYEMMVGYPPYFNNKREIMFQNIKSAPLHLPSFLSVPSKDLLRKLLIRDPSQRLGAHSDSEEIKKHPFFKRVDWGQVMRREQRMPRPPRHSVVPILIESSKVYGDLEATRDAVEGWTFISG
jgi:hypothetical protein